jgi:hypothetical protein
MALKDLKSDLSKFRKPVEKSLADQKRVEVPKTSNQTPLSQFVDNSPSAPKSTTTTPKQGVTPTKFDNSSKFIGETDPTKFDNSSKFIGETDPTKFDNSSKFIGETTPSKMSLQERYLGQTETTSVQQGDKFKGETTTANITQGDRFKGETTPQDYSNAEKFKGETTPTEFKFVQNFLGETTPNKSNLTSEFLGETTPNKSNLTSEFLGETTPNKSNLTSEFLGETTPIPTIQGDKFKGQTDTLGIKYNPQLETQAKDPKFVDFITNDDAKGFSPYQQTKYPSQFTAVDKTQSKFDSMGSAYSDYKQLSNGISFASGYRQFKSSKTTGDTQRYNPESLYEATYKSIGDIMEQRNSPSFLDEMYAKYNLKDDSPNSLNLIKAPYILRGIQRKKISKGEPQFWDFGLGVDDGFIRGGIVASTARAVTDTLRMGSFFLSVKGILWAVRQFGSQRTNKYGTLWTPINLLATTLGQHIGFRPSRHGLYPGDPDGVYKNILGSGYDDKLLGLYSKDIFGPKATNIGGSFATQIGGPDSIYGIGLTETKRFLNTFENPEKTYAHEKALFSQKYNPLSETPGKPDEPSDFNTYTTKLPLDADDAKKFGVANQILENTQSSIPIDEVFDNRGLYKSEGLTKGVVAIADYQAISYGKIAKRADKIAQEYTTDFREEYDNNDLNQNPLGGTDYSYKNQSRESKYKLPIPLARENKTFARLFGPASTKYDNDLKNADPINASLYNNKLENDFVHLFFAWDKGNGTQKENKIVQFRGTVDGISETYSPSWSGIKYPGRADQSYMYDTFERTLSFNFKAYALSRSEMKGMWNKLAELGKMTMPTYGSNTYTGHICYFRLGQLWGTGEVGVPSLITSLTYTVPTDIGWDLNQDGELAELPMGIDISIGLTILPTDNYYSSDKDIYTFSTLSKWK